MAILLLVSRVAPTYGLSSSAPASGGTLARSDRQDTSNNQLLTILTTSHEHLSRARRRDAAAPSRPGAAARLHARPGQRRAARLAAATLAPLGIEGRHYGVLAVLSELGPVSQQTLADVLCADRSTMVALVDELEERGYVRRGRNPSDRRAYAIELTDAGEAVQREAAELLEGCERHYLDPLSAAERRQLLSLLGRLVARDACDA